MHAQVVEALGARIVADPEQGLDPRDLGAEFGVSLTVIREALRVLSAKGLVAARQRRGTFVRPRAEWNLLDADVVRWRMAGGEGSALLGDLAEMRALVEPSAARLAAERRTDADLEALEEALAAMASAKQPDGAAAADAEFHRALQAATGNEMLARLHSLLEPALRARDTLVHSSSGGEDDPVPGHRAVLDAVRARDADAAARAMAELLAHAEHDARQAAHGTAPGSSPGAAHTTAPGAGHPAR
ncbi:FadR/GntR family transcriptional regulator [Mangrovactinospora gilvigrisea]|nr:FCD domain-containing protein [Mangrovactinospora gilvigrisea]